LPRHVTGKAAAGVAEDMLDRSGKRIGVSAERPADAAVKREGRWLNDDTESHGCRQIAIVERDFLALVGLTHHDAQRLDGIRIGVVGHEAQVGMLVDQQKGEDVGRLVEQSAEHFDEPFDLAGEGFALLRNRPHGARQQAIVMDEDLPGDILLGLEMPIERRFGDADGKRNIADRCGIDTLAREQM